MTDRQQSRQTTRIMEVRTKVVATHATISGTASETESIRNPGYDVGVKVVVLLIEFCPGSDVR